MRELAIIGAGGFGREVVDTVLACNRERPTWQVVGVVDDAPSSENRARLGALGVPFLGSVDDLPDDVEVVIGVGSPRARRSLAEMVRQRGLHCPAVIHPTAIVGSQFAHGEGLVVLGGVSIGTNVTLGEHVHLNAHAVLGHDVRASDFVSVNPNATVSGECTIMENTLLGASSTVLQQLAVGADVTIGAAACVTRSVPDGCTAVGVPAEPLQKGKSA